MRIDLSKPLNRLQSILAAILVTALAFTAALITESAKDVPLEEAVRVRASQIKDLQVVGNHLYYLESSGTLRCADSDGDNVWNVSVNASSSFRASEAGLAVWKGTRLSIYDKDTGVVIGSYNADDQVLDAIVGDSYAAVVVAPESDSKVIVTNHYGTVVEEIDGFKERTVLDIGFFETRALFWVMSLDSTGTLPSCTVDIYKPSKKQTGSIMQMNQVFYRVIPRSNQIACVGTDYLTVHDYVGTEKENERMTVYGWYLEAYDKNSDNPLLLFVPNEQCENIIAIKDIRCIKGTSEQMLHFPVKCTALACFGNTIYGFSGSQVAVGVYGSNSSNLYNLPEGVDGFPISADEVFGITDDRVAVIRSNGSLYLVRLPEE